MLNLKICSNIFSKYIFMSTPPNINWKQHCPVDFIYNILLFFIKLLLFFVSEIYLEGSKITRLGDSKDLQIIYIYIVFKIYLNWWHFKQNPLSKIILNDVCQFIHSSPSLQFYITITGLKQSRPSPDVLPLWPVQSASSHLLCWILMCTCFGSVN